MTWYQIFYDICNNLKTKNKTGGTMKDEKTKDEIKNPQFYSGRTFIGNCTGIDVFLTGVRDCGITDYDAYFGTDKAKETINNFKNSNIYKELANPHQKYT